ncbi:MAG: response regulator transcription factor [Lachnospiraceae bacterium]|nr:response regulator transcription factor [Lachnospiraceae bacterium]
MIKIAICDDEVFMTTLMEEMIMEMGKELHAQISCDVFFDGSALLESIDKGSCYDLIYLDIEMEQLGGIDTASRMRQLGLQVLIVYVSGHERYLKQLFDTEPFRFLSKPVVKEEFQSVFRAAYQRISQKPEYFSYVSSKALKKIPLNSIAYFESSKRVVYIHEAGKKVEGEKPSEKFYGKINEIEEQLSETHGRFLRIHQSYLVNFDFIKSINFTSVRMMDDTVLQISKERQKSIRHEFCALAGMEVMGGDHI